MSLLHHDMTPREPYDASLHRSPSQQSVGGDHHLRQLSGRGDPHGPQFDIRRGHLGEHQSLDGRTIAFENSPRGKESRAVSRSSSVESFYLGSGTWKPASASGARGQRNLDAHFNELNDPAIAVRKAQNKDELAHYWHKQREEREQLRQEARAQQARESDSGLQLTTMYGSRTHSRRSSNGNLASAETHEEREQRSQSQRRYAAELEEQLRVIRAEKVRLHFEDLLLTQKMHLEPFLKPSSSGTSPRRQSSAQAAALDAVPQPQDRRVDPKQAKAYRAELDAQVRHHQSAHDAQQRDAAAPMAIYYPYGKPGNGAALVDSDTGAVRGGLRRNFYTDAVDWLQLHERDSQPNTQRRSEYRSQLDTQLQTRQEIPAALSSPYTERTQLLQANAVAQSPTGGVSLPLAAPQRRRAQSLTGNGIPKTDIVLRPHNGGQLMHIHQGQDTDYAANGLAFGRPGAGAPLLDPVAHQDIDPRVHARHPSRSSTLPQAVEPNEYGTAYQAAYSSYISRGRVPSAPVEQPTLTSAPVVDPVPAQTRSAFVSARNSDAAPPQVPRSRAQSVSARQVPAANREPAVTMVDSTADQPPVAHQNPSYAVTPLHTALFTQYLRENPALLNNNAPAATTTYRQAHSRRPAEPQNAIASSEAKANQLHASLQDIQQQLNELEHASMQVGQSLAPQVPLVKSGARTPAGPKSSYADAYVRRTRAASLSNAHPRLSEGVAAPLASSAVGAAAYAAYASSKSAQAPRANTHSAHGRFEDPSLALFHEALSQQHSRQRSSAYALPSLPRAT